MIYRKKILKYKRQADLEDYNSADILASLTAYLAVNDLILRASYSLSAYHCYSKSEIQ